MCFSRYKVVVPAVVTEELQEMAVYDDAHARSATTVLDWAERFETRSVGFDSEVPLDDGENAAVTLANDVSASLSLCDEFTQLGLIHASLADTRLATTPTLLSVFVRTAELSAADARHRLEEMSDARSWDTNSYVQRARSLLDT